MPIYEYVCADCRSKFEKLVRRWGDAVDCPGCGSAAVEKQLSTFAVASSGSASASSAEGCGMPEGGCGAGACGGGVCGMPN
jgi:putative FmdB family regulatory protein